MSNTPKPPFIHEIHAAIGHLLCRLVDYFLFENVLARSQRLNLNSPKP
ncbi:hypothetical protein DSUL_20240 [Desulfovibrionales bacterium]